MKSGVLFVFAVIVSINQSLAAEGDLFNTLDGCFVELADGSREPTACPEHKPRVLSDLELEESIELFSDFENSAIAEEVKKASLSRDSMTKSDFQAEFSLEVREKAVHLKEGKYLVTITYLNEANYPRKYSRTANFPGKYPKTESYYTLNNGREYLDGTSGAQWESVILTHLVNSDHQQYSAKVHSVNDEFVVVKVFLDNSSQLDTITKGKTIKRLRHVGLPKVEYEEVRPT